MWVRKSFLKQKKFNHLTGMQKAHFQMNIQLFGQTVYLAGSRSIHKGPLMIIATNQKPQNAVAIYLRRWECESLFKTLKTHGFYFEDTHVIHIDRIEKIVLLLAVGFAWAHKVGEWQNTLKPIVLKQFIDSQRPQNSFFRYGLDFIREILLNPLSLQLNQFRKTIQVFLEPLTLASTLPLNLQINSSNL